MGAQHGLLHRSDWSRVKVRIKPLMREIKRVIKKQYHKLTKYGLIARLDYKFRRLLDRLPEPIPSVKRFEAEDEHVGGWFRCPECEDKNSLFYRQGRFPFGIMRCWHPRCHPWGWGCVINANTQTSDLLKRVDGLHNDVVAVRRFPPILNDQVPYFAVCNRCGLSHRAEKVDGASLTKQQRERYNINEYDLLESALISFEHIERCSNCNQLRDGNAKTQWLRFSIHYAPTYHLPNENYDGFYGDVIPKTE